MSLGIFHPHTWTRSSACKSGFLEAFERDKRLPERLMRFSSDRLINHHAKSSENMAHESKTERLGTCVAQNVRRKPAGASMMRKAI